MTSYIIPIIIVFILAYGVLKKVDVFDTFIEGAKEGIEITVKILPTMIYVITIVSIFRASGAADMFTSIFGRVLAFAGVPSEVMPLLLMKSVSGSASIAMLSDIIKTYGADSYLGRVAAIMTSSNETTLYTASVYAKGGGIKNTGPVIPVGLAADIFSGICAIFITNIFFSK